MSEFWIAYHQYQQAKKVTEALRGLSEPEVETRIDALIAATDRLMDACPLGVDALAAKIEVAIEANPNPDGSGNIEAPHAALILRDARLLAQG